MTGWLLTMVLSAWPVPADAGVEAYALAENWPNEPEWVQRTPFLSFTPNGWSTLSPGEAGGGVGMGIDRAWSLTRGSPDTVIVVVSEAFELADPLVAAQWKLNAGELPDAGDLNHNGRLDVTDFTGDARIVDVNGNGALDLQDVLAAFSNGVDDDGDGRIDDLCGWDYSRGAPVSRTRDAGATVRQLVAPVNDGLPGLGVCPECTVLPLIDPRLEHLAQGSRLVLVDAHFRGELSAALLEQLDAGLVLVTRGSGTVESAPLALHPLVLSPVTLTTTADRSTTRSSSGCGGRSRGAVFVSTMTCEDEAAATLTGIAALALSRNPQLDAWSLRGLLGGSRVDAWHVVRLADDGVVPTPPPSTLGTASLFTPAASGSACRLSWPDAGRDVGCDGGERLTGLASSRAEDAFARLEFGDGVRAWSVSMPAPSPDATRGLLALESHGWGSTSPRYVDFQRVEADTIALAGEASSFGSIDGDATLEVVTWSATGLIEVRTEEGVRFDSKTEQLSPPAVAPMIYTSSRGSAWVTVEQNGTVISRDGAHRWTAVLDGGALSAAVGHVDDDPWPDVAVTDGAHLTLLRPDGDGPTASGWAVDCTAREPLLADLDGDGQLEIIAGAVFDAAGRQRLELRGWKPSPFPAVLTPADATPRSRSLVQLEPVSDGRVELARYDVEAALRAGSSFVERELISTLSHAPAPGGMAVADVTADQRPDLLIPTTDGLLFIVDLSGHQPFDSPRSTFGTVFSAPAVGLVDNSLELSVRTTRGDLIRYAGAGSTSDIVWDGPGRDQGQTRNAEVTLHRRTLRGLGIDGPPVLQPPCGCGAGWAGPLAWLVFSFLRRRRC